MFNGILCFCLILMGGSTAAEMTCPEINENSTIGERTVAWNCDLVRWRNALAGLKQRVEQECPVSDEDEYWSSVFECPDFSEINCGEDTVAVNETDQLNCSISYCENGNYSDDTFLRTIWLHQFTTNKKFMIAYKRNLSDCLQSAGSAIDTYMTECPEVDLNSTNAELSIAWMCELRKWRNILGEWKQAVQEDCSIDDGKPGWQSTFECPDFSEVGCIDKQRLQNDTDSLDCPINFCSDGEYADTTILQIISEAQIDTYESATIAVSTSNLTCEPRKYSESLSMIPTVDESITESTTDPTATTKVTTDSPKASTMVIGESNPTTGDVISTIRVSKTTDITNSVDMASSAESFSTRSRVITESTIDNKPQSKASTVIPTESTAGNEVSEFTTDGAVLSNGVLKTSDATTPDTATTIIQASESTTDGADISNGVLKTSDAMTSVASSVESRLTTLDTGKSITESTADPTATQKVPGSVLTDTALTNDGSHSTDDSRFTVETTPAIDFMTPTNVAGSTPSTGGSIESATDNSKSNRRTE